MVKVMHNATFHVLTRAYIKSCANKGFDRAESRKLDHCQPRIFNSMNFLVSAISPFNHQPKSKLIPLKSDHCLFIYLAYLSTSPLQAGVCFGVIVGDAKRC